LLFHTSVFNGATEFAGQENADWKMTDKSAGLENAGLENDGQKLQGRKMTDRLLKYRMLNYIT